MGQLSMMAKARALFLLCLVAAAGAQPVLQRVQAVPVAIAVEIDEDGNQQIMIAMASRAPFPQPRAVSPQRMALMSMLANCQEEAVSMCGVLPHKPVCPMQLAR